MDPNHSGIDLCAVVREKVAIWLGVGRGYPVVEMMMGAWVWICHKIPVGMDMSQGTWRLW